MDDDDDVTHANIQLAELDEWHEAAQRGRAQTRSLYNDSPVSELSSPGVSDEEDDLPDDLTNPVVYVETAFRLYETMTAEEVDVKLADIVFSPTQACIDAVRKGLESYVDGEPRDIDEFIEALFLDRYVYKRGAQTTEVSLIDPQPLNHSLEYVLAILRRAAFVYRFLDTQQRRRDAGQTAMPLLEYWWNHSASISLGAIEAYEWFETVGDMLKGAIATHIPWYTQSVNVGIHEMRSPIHKLAPPVHIPIRILLDSDIHSRLTKEEEGLEFDHEVQIRDRGYLSSEIAMARRLYAEFPDVFAMARDEEYEPVVKAGGKRFWLQELPLALVLGDVGNLEDRMVVALKQKLAWPLYVPHGGFAVLAAALMHSSSQRMVDAAMEAMGPIGEYKRSLLVDDMIHVYLNGFPSVPYTHAHRILNMFNGSPIFQEFTTLRASPTYVDTKSSMHARKLLFLFKRLVHVSFIHRCPSPTYDPRRCMVCRAIVQVERERATQIVTAPKPESTRLADRERARLLPSSAPFAGGTNAERRRLMSVYEPKEVGVRLYNPNATPRDPIEKRMYNASVYNPPEMRELRTHLPLPDELASLVGSYALDTDEVELTHALESIRFNDYLRNPNGAANPLFL